ncbi:MAG: hypothetical protein E7212_06700 [Clostridium sartagoforme]|nr:hypothetical protein [Clostridium sartagoforme]
MKGDKSTIDFNEIRSYEDAYYYNSDPNDRIKYNNTEEKPEKKKSKLGNFVMEVLGDILEGALEIFFSFLD